MPKKNKASDCLKADLNLQTVYFADGTYATDSAKTAIQDAEILERVHYLKLKVPIDAWDYSTFTSENPDCPKVDLCRLHGELVFRVGKRYLPFQNAVEFVLESDRKGKQ